MYLEVGSGSKYSETELFVKRKTSLPHNFSTKSAKKLLMLLSGLIKNQMEFFFLLFRAEILIVIEFEKQILVLLFFVGSGSSLNKDKEFKKKT